MKATYKRILVYGDSNTWGTPAHNQGRYAETEHWTYLMQQKLGAGWAVIQNGLPGRVAGNLQKEKPYYNGQDAYPAILLAAKPVDIVIIALGTNDCQTRYHQTVQKVVENLLWYKTATKELVGHGTEVVYLLPANFRSTPEYFEANVTLRQAVVDEMKRSTAAWIEPPELTLSKDGVHYTLSDHAAVANAVYAALLQRGSA